MNKQDVAIVRLSVFRELESYGAIYLVVKKEKGWVIKRKFSTWHS